jgi:N-methylhydantoinase A/oxoprolinase/acetone carboxylase beta subunit
LIRVGVDVGGTHTDLVMVDDISGAISVAKVATSASDPSEAAMQGLAELCREAGREIRDIGHFTHGTTIATNIILQHNGAQVGLITTEGFRDILHIARHKRPHNFSLQLDLPWQRYPLVRRRHRLTVAGRIAPPNGDELIPLDEDAVRRAATILSAAGCEAIAVCFLFSFLDPRHEQRAAQIVRDAAPGMFVCTSSDVVPQYREYERFSTTCLNAYVGPSTARYLSRFEMALQQRGLRSGLHVMQSSGGSATVAAALVRPVTLLMSGPVGGLLGGIWAGVSAGFSNVITLDVGGTSADIGVAPGGMMQFRHLLDTRVGDYHAMVPMAEVDTIGAGGGSIAYVDSGGEFQVGPRSAGANPGPCCYGRGGTEPTATDCQLLLGRLAEAGLLGGRVRLDQGAAHGAVQRRLAAPLGVSVPQAALGALRILSQAMVQAIEVNSVRRGYDPRDFALVAFGGAGPLFACDVARELAVPHVVVPPLPGLTSALGLLSSDVSYEFSRTLMVTLTGDVAPRIAAEEQRLVEMALAQLREDGFETAGTRIIRYADCRYAGQGYELRTPAPVGMVGSAFVAALQDAFHQTHARQYGTNSPDKPVELVTLRVVGVGQVAPIRPCKLRDGTPAPPEDADAGTDVVMFDLAGHPKAIPTQRWRRDRLLAGNLLRGPAIVEQMDATTVIPPGLTARVDAHANLVIAMPADRP